MSDTSADTGWGAVLAPTRIIGLAVLLSGVLLYAMNALLVSTVLPSAVGEIGGVAYLTWPTAAYLATSIAAATGSGLLTMRIGGRRAFALAALVFCFGALICGSAGTMAQFIFGRLVQGAGGGMISALAYVMVRNVFPESLWPRVFALLSGAWGVAVLIGPLVGGVFAGAGFWRGAFYAVAGAGLTLAVAIMRVMPPDARRSDANARFPAYRLALVAASIFAMSTAGVLRHTGVTLALIAFALAAIVLMLRTDRRARDPLLPSDAFTFASAVGLGLWIMLLLSLANDPFPIYGPLFLQRLHGFDPLSAGYLVAIEAMAWTLTAVAVTSLPARYVGWLLIGGPLTMGAGLAGISVFMADGPIWALVIAIYLAGAGIGSCWAFVSQRIMAAAKPGEEDIAAAATPTVQLFGLAFGATIAGLIANLVGYSEGLSDPATRAASFWVPIWFVLATLGAAFFGWRLMRLR